MTDLDELERLLAINPHSQRTYDEYVSALRNAAPAMIAELKSLRAELDAAAESRYRLQEDLGRANEELRKLRAEAEEWREKAESYLEDAREAIAKNEALRKDVERYRWLRRGNGDYYIARARDGKAIHDPDTFIDAAIATAKKLVVPDKYTREGIAKMEALLREKK